MPLTIDENKCARCGVCEAECPNEAIVETEDAYVIEPKLCTGCVEHYGEHQCKAACSYHAIQPAKNSLFKKCLSLLG